VAPDGHKLVIVESPAKARTISGFLGRGYVVESSVGHIRGLPNNASEVPAKYKGESWGRLGVNVDDGFRPIYVVPADKKKQISKLRSLLKDADELYLATDEDREGEAIAWHLLDELKPKIPVRRMVFHEITPQAIAAAMANPRDIDNDLVEAQETRRIVDRLYGYEVSPVLWKKVMSGTSAGRVQSVAIRLVVDRERERMAFRTASYWDLEASFDAGEARTSALPTARLTTIGGEGSTPRLFPARLTGIDGRRVAQGRDFTSTGEPRDGAQVVTLDEPTAVRLADGLREQQFQVSSVEAKPYRRQPYPPFRTTTLQQEASRKLGFGAARTMQVAQRLYEEGFITYMRTDSITLSATAISAARAQVSELFGSTYLPAQPRTYKSKVKNAQEAHEAIRPAGEHFRTPAQTGLTGETFRLYELIWMRTVASQMKDAEGRSVSVRISADATTGEACEFSASGRVITFHGFLKAYVEDRDDPDGDRDDSESRLPDLTQGDRLTAADLAAAGHETRPPSRYTEATLVRELEEREIGRPSTYATIIGTILGRGYVYKKGSALVPAWLAFSVVRLLERHFARLVDYNFTAGMEDVLDEVAAGRRDSTAELAEFYFGSGDHEGLKSLVSGLGEIDARELSTFRIDDDLAVRVGRYGPYVEASDGSRANVPDDLPPDELTPDKARELLANPAGLEVALGSDPATGYPVVAKNGRYGPYVIEVLPADAPKTAKPRTSSLFSSMSLDTIELDQALSLLTLPREVGVDPVSGETITAQNGRYGPYLKKGADSRSIESEEQLLTITLVEALAIYAQPKQRGRRAAAAPVRELGADPATSLPVVVKDGRFGPYVTDGEVNATLRRGDEVESLTLERAAELLRDKRAKSQQVTGRTTPLKKPVKGKRASVSKSQRATGRTPTVGKAVKGTKS